MKKRLWKLGILVAATLMLAITVTACGGSSGGSSSGGGAANEAAAETADPTGTYIAVMDLKEVFNKSAGAEIGLQFKNPIETEFFLELKDDGSFVMEVDGEEMVTAIKDAMTAEGPDLMKEALIDQGISEDQFDAIANAAGFETFDAFVDDLFTEMLKEMDDSLSDSMKEIKTKGNYTINGNKIKLDEEYGDITVDTGTINDDGSISMKIDLSDADEMELVFKKQ